MALTHIEQLRAARSLIGISQAELAERSGVSLPTIKRVELGNGPIGGRPDTIAKLERSLVKAGVSFIPENGGGPGVRLAKRKRK